MDLDELFKRHQDGEDVTLLANEVGLSVAALFARFTKAGYIKVGRNKDIDWKDYYLAFTNNDKSVLEIAKELDVTPSTVYNNFNRFGYNRKSIAPVNDTQIYQEHLAGTDVSELARKYERSPTYIRFLIRRLKQAQASAIESPY